MAIQNSPVQTIYKNKIVYDKLSKQLFFIDFFLPKIKIGFEIDGNHHNKPNIKEYDEARTSFLNSIGIRIIRFKNQEVFETETKIKLFNLIENIKTVPKPKPVNMTAYLKYKELKK